AHPVAITYISLFYEKIDLKINAVPAIIMYFEVVLVTLVVAVVMRRLGDILPFINKGTIGVYPKKTL
ncbi:MAG: acyltransferase, partial [Anaerovibrio sp.]|nr:acyltransferase [Anaerovibrio sp.]